MSFTAPEAYDRFMGRYSRLLAPKLADFAGVTAGQRALDVGSGPGALTAELVARLGAEAVSAVDPSQPFVETLAERQPGVEVRRATAEHLPFADSTFDVTLAQLAVHFMTDPVRGIAEMRRVTRREGVVGAAVWDYAGERSPLDPFWEVARRVDPSLEDESHLPGVREGHLLELFRAAGFDRPEESVLVVELEHPGFDAWWEPFTLGVGPAGAYVTSLDPDRQDALREAVRERLPEGTFVTSGHAWAVRATA